MTAPHLDLEDPRRYEFLTRLRLEDPQAVARAAQARRRHPGPTLGEQNFIVAADHTARGAMSAQGNPTAMNDRRELLDRMQRALANPAVDGVLASPDILDDLLLLGALDGKLIFGSMNRGGLAGSPATPPRRSPTWVPTAARCSPASPTTTWPPPRSSKTRHTPSTR
ncbi:hypothetical protein GCM10027591_16670 [Zhihengliuella somnathii]